MQLRALARAAVARQSQGHAADGDRPGGDRGGRGHARRGARRACRAKASRTRAAARHHGRGAGRRDRAGGLCGAAFFSIGSNDLTQYVTAAARDNAASPHSIRRAQSGGDEADRRRRRASASATGIEVSLCGDAAGDPALVPSLLEAGLRNLSVAPAHARRRSRRRSRGRGSMSERASATDDPTGRGRRSPTTRRSCSSVLEPRPSGTRQRLADALGKNRSFVTQITSPAYDTPIPARHLSTIVLESATSRRASGTRSSPPTPARIRRQAPPRDGRARRAHVIADRADLGDDKQQPRARHGPVNDFVAEASPASTGEGS